jgi:phenylacetate-coenzyme A ligase PaaK-like adenylate-forming protein
LLGAEALTDAKREVIEAAGCEAYARYGVSELGQVGVACPQMNKGDTVHVCRDSLAVISYRRMAPLTEVEIDSLMFTTSLPCAAFVLINAEMDDSGVLEPARCDCHLKEMGFTQQLSNIYSYGRLTGQGMTLVGVDIVRILERSLPKRFGGTTTDYQLVECEGKNQTEMELRVHPRVGARSPDEIKKFASSAEFVGRFWLWESSQVVI